MSSFYIYSFYLNEGDKGYEKKKSIAVIFCPREDIDEAALKEELKRFYEHNYIPDELHVIGGGYLRDQLTEVFIRQKDKTFTVIPKMPDDFVQKQVWIITFDANGKRSYIHNQEKESSVTFKRIINEGLTKIFNDRGGLVIAPTSHHYVFPSGKHCDKFLRTGNVLLYSSEIFFIAFTILEKYDYASVRFIYCDTSSINSIAFAVVELKRRLVVSFHSPPIESFSSYEGFNNAEFKFKSDALLLVSSSTSGSIIDRIIASKNAVPKNKIIIIYFLGKRKDYLTHQDNIICDLTHDKKTNALGIEYYPTFKIKDGEKCVYCENGSHPVLVKGDAFLTDNAIVRKYRLTVNDSPKNLSNFIKNFISKGKNEFNVLKVHYFEGPDPDNRYEIYFDLETIIEYIDDNHFNEFRKKLNKYINQTIPFNTKYLIYLDSGSQKFAKYIRKMIFTSQGRNYAHVTDDESPLLVYLEDTPKISDEVEGAAVIVCPCLVRGRNLLYASRILRDYKKLSKIYFVGLSRTVNEDYYDFIKKNLGQGVYGGHTNVFVDIEKFFCYNEFKGTSWILEENFLKSFIDYYDALEGHDNNVLKYFTDRKDMLINSTRSRGIANRLFFPKMDMSELDLGNTFAFFDFESYHSNISQADVYFAISAILNHVRNHKKEDKNFIMQTEYIRTLLDPDNFQRFNDGIIQASLLRAANESELSYNIDNQASYEMLTILINIVKHDKNQDGEALMEFLLSVGLKKLKLIDKHMKELFEEIAKNITNKTVLAFFEYVKYVYYKRDEEEDGVI